MAACVICNQQTIGNDLQNVGDLGNLCARLEKVLEETVPQDSVMCSKCQFDLAQIEMYYALLNIFKRRYSDSVKQRLQNTSDNRERNLLHETVQHSSNNLPSIFGARDSSKNANTGSLLQPQVMKDLVSPETYSPVVKLEIQDIRTVKDELEGADSAVVETLAFSHLLKDHQKQTSPVKYNQEVHKSLQMVNTSGRPYSASADVKIHGTCSDGSVEAAAWESDLDEFCSKNQMESKASDGPPAVSTGQVPKKRGRPRKKQQPGANLSPGAMAKKSKSNISSLDMVAIPRKRGRPRKNEQLMGPLLDVPTKSVKKRGRPRKDASVSSTAYAKKPGQPQKYKHQSESKHEDLHKDSIPKKEASVSFEEPKFEECSLGGQNTDESDADDPSYNPKWSSSTPTVGSKGHVKNEPKQYNTGDSITEGSRTNSPSTKNKHGRPKKIQARKNVAALIPTKLGRPKKGAPPRPVSPCTKCGKVFINPSALKIHMTSHIEDRAFICPVCSKGYKTLNQMNSHKKVHMADKPYKCEICGKGFVWKKLLKVHLAVHSDARPFECDQCDRNFKTRRNLRTHVKSHHMDGRKYLCNLCGLALLQESTLKNHLKIHSEERPFKCETCGMGFVSKARLSYHEVVHDNVDTREKYLCPICGKELLQKSYLPIHMKQHSAEPIHTCSVCNTTFVSKNGYRRHMMIHRGETPHRCSECGKGFVSKSNLKQHMLTHTGERPHKCSCGQGFQVSSGLHRHMQRKGHAALDGKPVSQTKKRLALHTVSAPTSGPTDASLPLEFTLPIAPPQPTAPPQPSTPLKPTVATAVGSADQHAMMSAYQAGSLLLSPDAPNETLP